jgi:hypothetical protein
MDKRKEKLESRGLIEKEISKLPEDICKDIKAFPLIYQRNNCHKNAIIAPDKIKYNDAEERIVEGVVLCDDGYLFEHFWNRVFFKIKKESADFDITLDVIASDEEKEMKKTYYEYANYSSQEMNNHNSFSPEINEIISDYYRDYPTHYERYINQKNQLTKMNNE